MNRPRFTVEQVVAALQQARGIKNRAAKILGCSRGTVDNYIQRHPQIAAAYAEACESLLDDATSSLVDLVDQKYWPAVRFLLATLGKNRGFTERTEIAAELDAGDGQDLAAWQAAIEKIYGANSV